MLSNPCNKKLPQELWPAESTGKRSALIYTKIMVLFDRQESFYIYKLIPSKNFNFILNSTTICLLRSDFICCTRVLRLKLPLEHVIGVNLNNQNKLDLDSSYAKITVLGKVLC